MLQLIRRKSHGVEVVSEVGIEAKPTRSAIDPGLDIFSSFWCSFFPQRILDVITYFQKT